MFLKSGVWNKKIKMDVPTRKNIKWEIISNSIFLNFIFKFVDISIVDS